MTPPALRFAPRLTVEVPPGLQPYEHVELRNDDGQVLATIQGLPVGDSIGLAEIVDHDVDALRTAGFEPVTLDRTDGFGGRPAAWVTVRPHDGAGITVRVYSVDGGWTYIATAGSADATADAERELIAMLSSIDLRGLPRPAAPPDNASGSWRRHRGERPDWSRVRDGWTGGVRADPSARPAATCFTAEELAAVAALARADSFPGVRPDLFEGWSNDARGAAIGTATRSLAARGVLVVDAAGALVPSAEWREPFAIAVDPDLIVVASLHDRSEARGVSFACTDEHVVAVAAAGPDLVWISTFEPEALAGAVRDVVGLVDQTGDGTSFATTDEALASAVFDGDWSPPGPEASMFADQVAQGAALARFVALHREGDTVDGGELRWIVTPSGLWEYSGDARDSATSPVELRSVGSDDLLATLVSYLPGGIDAATASASLK